MLLTPRRKIITLRLTVFFVLLGTFFSLFLLVKPYKVTNVLNEDDIRDEGIGKATYGFSSEVDDTLPLIFIYMSVFGVILSSIISIVLLFLYTPSFTQFMSEESVYKMKWRQTKYVLPERIMLIEAKGAFAIIKRNRSSLSGIFLNNYIMEVHIQKSKILDVEGVMNHIGIMKFEERESEYVGYKTVSISHIPVQIIQLKAILDIYI